MLKTVKITMKDGSVDIRECHDLSEIPLDNVDNIKVIREEDEADYPSDHAKQCCLRKAKRPNKQD